MNDRYHILKSKFFYLLSSLIAYLIAISLLNGVNDRNFLVGLLFSLVIFGCVLVVTHNRNFIFFAIVSGLVSVFCHWRISTFDASYYEYLIYYFSCIVLLAVVLYYILASIAKHKEITTDSLFGAVCGYFFLGMAWSFVFIIIQTFDAGAFSKNLITISVHKTAENFFYYSFTTMTTLGYGDILPVSSLARTLSWLEAITGQVYLAVWISQLVGLKIAQRLR